MGDRERKDIHLSLSPELLYKAGKLPPDLRQMFKSSTTKKVLLFWPGCLLQTQKHLVNPSSTGLGELCVLHPPRPSPALSAFPPSLLHADTDRHSLVGTCSSISLVYKIFCVPWVYLLAALDWSWNGWPLSNFLVCVFYVLGWRRRSKGEGSGSWWGGKEERGVGVTMPKWGSFSIFVFLKK